MKKWTLLLCMTQVIHAVQYENVDLMEHAAQLLDQALLKKQKNILDIDLVELMLKMAPLSFHQLMGLLEHFEKNVKILPKSILLVGKPGIGKSTLARALAIKNNIPYLFIECPLLANEYKNSGAQNLYRALSPALSTDDPKPYIIILDEINALVEKSENYEHDKDSLFAFMSLFDKLQQQNPLSIIIATTNSIHKFPEPIKSRFQECIEFNLPNARMRKKIIKFHVLKKGMQYNDDLIKLVVKNTHNFSGRDLEYITNMIASQAITHMRSDGKMAMHKDDVDQVLKNIKTNKLLEHVHQSYFSKTRSFVTKHANLIITLTGIFVSLIVLRLQNQSLQLQAEASKLTKNGLVLQQKSLNQQDSAIFQQKIGNTIGVGSLLVGLARLIMGF